ncbi:MAG: putative signaling protein [Actinomycetia bacterium]|nr:putative signaling protein [Actinomycetes bacterium]
MDRPRRELAPDAIDALLGHASETHFLLDLEGNVLFAIGQRGRDFERDDGMASDIRDRLHPDDLLLGREVIADLARHPDKEVTVYGRVRNDDGSYRMVEILIVNRMDDPRLGGLVARARDVGSTGAGEPALMRSMSDLLPAAIVVGSADGTVVYANPVARALLGRTLDELRGEPWIPAGTVDGELTVELQREDRWISARIVQREDEGLPLGWIAVLDDVTERRQATEALSYQALHDSLTGLPNRRAVLEELRTLLADADRGPISLLYVDLDGFKAVNDGHGHAGGDRVLVELGRRLVGAARASDVVARIGGDEFAVLCRGASPAEADAIADRVVAAVSHPIPLDGGATRVGASVGVITVAAGEAGRTPDDVLNQADLAMYEVKRGR